MNNDLTHYLVFPCPLKGSDSRPDYGSLKPVILLCFHSVLDDEDMRSFPLLFLIWGASAIAQTAELREFLSQTGPQPEEQGKPVVSKDVRVTARALRIRTANGTHVCSVPRGTILSAISRDTEEDRIQVKINAKGCPSEGYVYSNYVLPVGSSLKDLTTEVEVSMLSLRGRPDPEGSYLCGLPEKTKVVVVQDDPPGASSGAWVEVSITDPPKGCPSRGYVNSSYLNPNESLKTLPLISTQESDPNITQENTEASAGCLTGDCNAEQVSEVISQKNLNEIKAVLPQGEKNEFLEALRQMMEKPGSQPKGFSTSRGLIQMPLLGSKGNIGACGSFHYNPDSPKGVDAYANPTTACAFTAFLQDWKKNECPSGGGCRIAWGDISHKRSARFNGHRSHTDGHCIDIRPPRKGSFENAPLTYNSGDYSKETMQRMVEKMRQFGADTMYFNDPGIDTKRASGHHNHLHVCFKPGPKTREACQNLTIDPNTCPELL